VQTANDVVTVDRRRALAFRARRHELTPDPEPTRDALDVALLDYGVQDTGPDGSSWALVLRGAATPTGDELALAWTLRGAPHAYRRRDLAAVAVATAPYSEADARKRVFDASKPLKDAGIDVLDALRKVASEERDIVRRPTSKGELSTKLTTRLDQPYLRWCRVCQATHAYEQPFRLAALQGGLELEPGSSPPVLRRIPGLRAPLYRRLADEAEPAFDVVRGYLRFYGPARITDAAAFIDAPVAEVKARWPDDVVEVRIDGEHGPKGASRFVLADDVDALAGSDPVQGALLLGPFDPYLQARDRELLVADEAARKELWRTIGRPGGVLVDGEVVGFWRPRTAAGRLALDVTAWARPKAAARAAVEAQAERLAAHRGVAFAGVTWT